MRRYYVTLIQDAYDFVTAIHPAVDYVIQTYYQEIQSKHGSVPNSIYIESREALYRWIICEEIQIIYGIYTSQHSSRHGSLGWSNSQILDLVKNHIDVDQLFTQHLFIPRVYNDNFIYVTLNHLDLIIQYDRNSSPLL